MIKTYLKRSFLGLIMFLFLVSYGFAHMLWIERNDGKFEVFWGHVGKVEPIPEFEKEIKAFDKKGKSLKLKEEAKEGKLILDIEKKPSLIVISMKGVYIVTTPEGKKRMDKIEAQKQGLQVVDSACVFQATKGIFEDSSILRKPLGLKLEPIFVETPYKGKNKVRVKVLYEHKPAEGVIIFNAFHKELAKTDSKGMVELNLEDLKIKEGYYGFVAFYKVKVNDPKADYYWFMTSLTWQK